MSLFTKRNRDETRSGEPFVPIKTWGDLVSVISGRGPGKDVPISQALYDSTVWACIDVLASSISSTPVDAVRKQGGARLPVEPAPPLITAPSAIVDSDVWLYQLAASVATDGNAFGRIVARDAYTFPTQIELIDPAKVTNRTVVDGVPTVTIDSRVEQLYPLGDIWHCPGKHVFAGSPFALSPLKFASGSVDVSLSAQELTSKWFHDGGHPTALLKVKVADLSQEEAAAIKKAWIKATTGPEPAVVGNDIDYQSVQSTLRESGVDGAVRTTVESICRVFRVPPAMIYAAISGQNVTYANVTQADLAYLKHSLNPYLVRIERALGSALPARVAVRFNRNAILQADPAARWALYEVRLRTKTISINEVRALEDEPPFADPVYDLPGIPNTVEPAINQPSED